MDIWEAYTILAVAGVFLLFCAAVMLTYYVVNPLRADALVIRQIRRGKNTVMQIHFGLGENPFSMCKKLSSPFAVRDHLERMVAAGKLAVVGSDVWTGHVLITEDIKVKGLENG